ncbi:MAG TPA: DegT/DnrJ/EryC1/StrS family aminotransferase [Thermoanaerobaculaceae bacterium]|nr:DegT/DnrJ/EryC1/StrS family aminotransferase [Thermoanaerobaculaceae bacterium]
MTGPIPFFQHDLGQPELDAVREVLSGPILTTGATVERFEKRLAEYLHAKHLLTVTSCTGAMHLSLLALGVGPGDEVITTPMTFIATSTAIMEAGATPVFVDVEEKTGNLDVSKVEAAITARTRAILPVHLYGQMCDMRALRAIADAHRLHIIEDSAHCIEGERDGVRPGQLSDTACLSFYATKNLSCGEGGAIVCNDAGLAERLRLLRLHGMTKTAYDRSREGYQHWDMVALGWKYNMDNIHAALLLPQLDRLDATWRKRDEVARRYHGLLAEVPGLTWPRTLPDVKHAHHLFPVWIVNGRRDQIVAGLNERGIPTVVNYRAIHLLTYFRERFGFKPGDFPMAERIGDAALSLPFYPGIPVEHVEAVADGLKALLSGTC